MAIKGLAYTKTTWSYGERPVSSAKLNAWDDRMEAALELAFYLLSQAWGGGDGVVRGAAPLDLQVQALGTPGLAVLVEPGWAFIGNHVFRLTDAVETAAVDAPVSNDRVDLVQARLEGWTVNVKEGAEAASPTAPEADEDCIALAHLYLRPGMASIEASDDGVNGYIIDARRFL